jgi:hypothetical protein
VALIRVFRERRNAVVHSGSLSAATPFDAADIDVLVDIASGDPDERQRAQTLGRELAERDDPEKAAEAEREAESRGA